MAKARFSQINLVTHDLMATLAFYRRLGLELPEGTVWEVNGAAHHATLPGASPVELQLDSRRLAQAPPTWASPPSADGWSSASSWTAATPSMPHWTSLLEESVQGLQPPFITFWGARYAIVEDPDGNPVGLMSPVDPARRSAPPELEWAVYTDISDAELESFLGRYELGTPISFKGASPRGGELQLPAPRPTVAAIS